MDEKFLSYLLSDNVSINIGANAREILRKQAEEEFNNNHTENSIFYQIKSLLQTSQHRYYYEHQSDNDANKAEARREHREENTPLQYKSLMSAMNALEISEFTNNVLIQHVCKVLKSHENKSISNAKKHTTHQRDHLQDKNTCNFLKDVIDPKEGFRIIENVCSKLPDEWTILQLWKGPHTETTFSNFTKIHEHDAPIYLTILKHARSYQYPQPLCIRFSSAGQKDLFQKIAVVQDRFKQCIKTSVKHDSSTESKKNLSKRLDQFNEYIATIIADLRSFFYPWNFLFNGTPYSECMPLFHLQRIWLRIDDFCTTNQWQVHEHMLLSLAAMHTNRLWNNEISAICRYLTKSPAQQAHVKELLLEIRRINNELDVIEWRRYPCILIVDECLDHFYWEVINAGQEYCRINSLQSLWHLYNYYKSDIRDGYLHMKIDDGACLLNPDNTLPKMEMRMRSFFDYWRPDWKKVIGEKPKHDDLFAEFFNRKCYIYAGHGSGLQYAKGTEIAKKRINSVILLFGCDSCRLFSNGLFSELVGPHQYYHGAMCPAVVGTLLPGFDVSMDKMAARVISRWIAPKSLKTLPWNDIDVFVWGREGRIQPYRTYKGLDWQSTTAAAREYNTGSLCLALSYSRQFNEDKNLYNIVSYVCRGLPVWNTHIHQPPPSELAMMRDALSARETNES